MTDVMKVADTNNLEITVSVNDPMKERMEPGEFEGASIEVFMLRDDEKLGDKCQDFPQVLGRLIAGSTVWFSEEDTPARNTFRLNRDAGGHDIPTWLPLEIKYHVLMAAQASFEYMNREL